MKKAKRKKKKDDEKHNLSNTSFLFSHSIAARTSREYYASHECIRDCSSSQAKECVYDFDIEYWSTLSRNCFDCPQNQADCYRAHCVTADGRQRGIKTVNRMLPGPSIQVCVNDTVVVRVHNELISRESITVHWHGVHIVPSMDGAEMITQCPILSGTSFEYKFDLFWLFFFVFFLLFDFAIH